MRPRARRWPLAGRLRPVSCQLAVVPTRVPPPSAVQVLPPSVLRSKVTCETSGELPPRVHSTRVASGGARRCVAVSFASRASLLRFVPLTLPNLPLRTTFPSACTVTPCNGPSAPPPVLKLVSRLPSALNRAMRLIDVPFNVVKLPPRRIFPSACKATLSTRSFAPLRPLPKVLSRVPSAFSRTMWLAAVPLKEVKEPPSKIFPSGCTRRQ